MQIGFVNVRHAEHELSSRSTELQCMHVMQQTLSTALLYDGREVL